MSQHLFAMSLISISDAGVKLSTLLPDIYSFAKPTTCLFVPFDEIDRLAVIQPTMGVPRGSRGGQLPPPPLILCAYVLLRLTFWLLADGSADISGKEQLSIGITYYDKRENNVKDEFMGFVELEKMDAQTIASEINAFINALNIDVNKCVGQDYDGCATMAASKKY